ncbi:efflux RND transporter periplasmic adaptor subunit [Pantoea sp. JK]|uniref:efflux RND transporter periplasmic adaptor subunit n=1 Tax=Pantoea sp. JK TaxID=2871703 RepID=UPI002238B55B|nr:efflux RND transporter periplasmic adaptor subunit [Pantoea sp. JK]MCW6034565.1 efflux RND transporter periplasmic adaptor subunit [Pantoea sp. JK]
MTDSFTGLVKQAANHLIDAQRLIALLPLLPCMVVIALSLTACGPRDPLPPAPPRPVKFIIVKPATQGRQVQMTGDIHAHDETSLGFRLDGRILARSAEVGDRVNAGQVLATLESSTTQNALQSAMADTDSARATERVAALNLHRMKQLMPSGAIARAQLDSAQSDWQSAAARLQSSEAALNNAKENLRWTQLTAPFSGVITAVSASAGQVVSAGQTVMSLASGTQRDVVMDVPFPAAFSSLPGDAFHVSLLASPAIIAQAHLRDISPQADPQTRTWRVRLTLNDPPPAMLLGASVSVALPESDTRTFILPASVLTRLAGKPAVFVLDAQRGKVARRIVVISRFTASEVYIASGLTAGESVVTAGVSTLRDGEAVSLGDEQP